VQAEGCIVCVQEECHTRVVHKCILIDQVFRITLHATKAVIIRRVSPNRRPTVTPPSTLFTHTSKAQGTDNTCM
jgi:hypothetical protein